LKLIETLNEKYSTTKLCYKLLDDKYLDENGKVKDDLKFNINIPEFEIKNSKIIPKPEDKFETHLFLPKGEGRKEEGGLRTKGYFKFSYEKANDNEWWLINSNNKKVKKVELPNNELSNSYYPLISIITVVYNGEKYLEETIQSVINQTYPNVEYIIIDGGSTDKTLDIIKKYEDYIDYWVSEKDNGIYDAMNKGLKLSFGIYISILNSDDFYKEDAIKKSVEAILKNKVDYSIANVRFSDNSIIKPIFPLECKIYQEMPYPHVSAVISNKVYKKVCLFDEKFKIAGDHDMAVRIILKGYSYVYIDQEIAILQKGGVSSSIKSNIESCKVVIQNGKNPILAVLTLCKQFINLFLSKILPKTFVSYIQKIKGSRFYD